MFLRGRLSQLGLISVLNLNKSILYLDVKILYIKVFAMAKIYRYSGSHLFLLLWKASHAVMRYDQKSISRQGFASLSDFAVLEVLLHKGSLPVNTIGQKVLLSSGSITTAVQRLEKKGLLRKERREDDARVVLVHLTEAGHALIVEAFAHHSENLNELFDVFTDEERVQFAGLIRQIGQRAVSLGS
jgi:MarR family 2-MHQ and catechol resistance regulon transcriptional repressor